MKVSRHFLFTSAIIILIGIGCYYFFSKSAQFFDKVNAENLSPLDSYLHTHYGFRLNLEKNIEDQARIYCDQSVSVQEENGTQIAYPCQNNNPVHKIVIGWATLSLNDEVILKSLSNEQLFWRQYPSFERLDGTLSCSDSEDFAAYRDARRTLDCLLVTTDGEKLYSSTVLIKNKEHNLTLFVSVVNTVKKSSPQKVKQELRVLLSNIRKNDTALSLIEKVFNSEKDLEALTQATSSTAFSTEGEVPSRSGSGNVVTKDSGSGIDATVCDLTDSTICYPLYCDSVTSVWNYSLNKCVQPIVVSGGEESCPTETPVWDGSKCRELTGNIISGNSCTIPVGGNSCSMNVFWSVQTAKGQISVKRLLSPTESLIVGNGTSSTITLSFPYESNPHKVALYDGAEKIQEGLFVTKCSRGGWDDKSKTCVDPNVTEVKVKGEYYSSPGFLQFSCDDSDTYYVRNDTNTTIASGTYLTSVEIPLIKSGNYSIVCSKGTYASNGAVRYYNAPPPPKAHMTFNITPRTVEAGGTTTLNWTIDFPRESCLIDVKTVCKPSGCSIEEQNFENEIRQLVATDQTDIDDPEGQKPIAVALKQITGNHVDNDFKTAGKKTFNIFHTTDFTLHCGDGVLDIKKRVYIRTNK